LKKAVVLLCALGLAALVGFKLLPNEERAIRNLMDRLVEAASIKPGEGNLARMSRANQLAEFFTKDVTINLQGIGYNVPVITSRGEIREAILAAHSHFRLAEFRVDALQIIFPQGNKRAAVSYVFITGQINSEPERFGQQFRMDLEKIEHRWLITNVNLVEGLK
jgi:hypothetical protein